MSYPDPLPTVTRSLSDDVVVILAPFDFLHVVPIGARTALFRYQNQVVVWLPLPYGDYIDEALAKWGSNVSISWVIVANTHHCMCAHQYKRRFPDARILAPEGTPLKEGCRADVIIPKSLARQKLLGDRLKSLGVDNVIVNNFEFEFLDQHYCDEVVTYEKNLKTLFVGDLLFNFDGEVEQFQVGGPSWRHCMLWKVNPRNYYGQVVTCLFNMVFLPNSLAKEPLRVLVNEFDFDRVVMCHGNDLEGQDVKKVLVNALGL